MTMPLIYYTCTYTLIHSVGAYTVVSQASAHVCIYQIPRGHVTASIQMYAIYILGKHHAGQNCELCLSVHGGLPRRLWYIASFIQPK